MSAEQCFRCRSGILPYPQPYCDEEDRMTETNKREHEHDCLEQVIDGVVELGDNQSDMD